jgi:hypothetical protein
VGDQQNPPLFSAFSGYDMLAAFYGEIQVSDFALDESIQVDMDKIEELFPRRIIMVGAASFGEKGGIEIAAGGSCP